MILLLNYMKTVSFTKCKYSISNDMTVCTSTMQISPGGQGINYWCRIKLEMYFIHCFKALQPWEKIGPSYSWAFGDFVIFVFTHSAHLLPLFLTMQYCILAVHMCQCWGQYKCMSFWFCIATRNYLELTFFTLLG